MWEQGEGEIWRFRPSAQWREMSAWFGPWATVGRFRVWRDDACVFTRPAEGLFAEGAGVGTTDLAPVAVDSTTVCAHLDAAGPRVGKHLMSAVEEAAHCRRGRRRETARQKGAARANRSDRASDGTSGAVVTSV